MFHQLTRPLLLRLVTTYRSCPSPHLCSQSSPRTGFRFKNFPTRSSLPPTKVASGCRATRGNRALTTMISLSSRSTVASVRVVARHGLSRQQRCQVAPLAYSTGHYTTFSLSTEDRLEILDLCHKFDNLLNMGRQDKLGELFAPDAQVISPVGAVKGVGPILEYFHSCKPLAAGNRHLTCNVLVEADGVNSAKVTAYRLLHKCCCPPVLLASGTIEDKLVSINGEWRFSQRVFNMDPPAQPQQQAKPMQASSNGKN